MDLLRPDSGSFENSQRLPEFSNLGFGERWVESVLDIREMRVGSFYLDAGQLREFADKAGQSVQTYALSIGSGFDLQVNERPGATLLRRLGQRFRDIKPIEHLPVAVSGHVIELIEGRMSEDRHRFVYPEASNHQSLMDTVNTQPISPFGGNRCGDFESMTVCICLHDGHDQSSGRRRVPERINVAFQPCRINFNPREHELDYSIRYTRPHAPNQGGVPERGLYRYGPQNSGRRFVQDGGG